MKILHNVYQNFQSHTIHSVMPMEIFVSCVDDLATLGRVRVGLDPACFPPGSFFSFLFCPRGVGEWKVSLWQSPCDLVEWSFWDVVTEARSMKGHWLFGQIFGWSVSALPGSLDFLGFFPDQGLLITVYILPFMLI